VPLLATAVFISYFDRGILSTASPLIQDEFGLTKTQLGFLLAAFFWSYAPMQPLAGWLAQRLDVRYVLGCGLALWALSTTLTGLVTSILMIQGLRILLGLGESVVYPSNAKFLGQCAAVHERGRANGLIAIGQALGPGAGTLLSGLVMARWGWRAAFLVFGVLSLVWLVPWFVVTRGGTTPKSAAAQPSVSYWMILRERAVWGTSLGHFCGNYAYYFMLTWLPLLLVKQFNFSLRQMAIITGVVYAIQAVSAAVMGWWCDRAIRRGDSANGILKSGVIAGLLFVTVAMAACTVSGPALSVTLMMVAAVGVGLQSSPANTITQTLGGAQTAGQWMGIENLIANLAGVIAPPVTGALVDATHSYIWAFVVAASVTLLGVLAYSVVIKRVEPIRWPADETP
jgi:MFS family permease